MRRSEARQAFRAAYSLLAPQVNPDTVDRDFETWWRRSEPERHEAARASGTYTIVVALAPGDKWSPGASVRECVPGHKPDAKARCMTVCDTGHPDDIGWFIQLENGTDPETGWALGLCRILCEREKVKQLRDTFILPLNAYAPDKATGKQLDDIAALAGVERGDPPMVVGTKVHKYVESELKAGRVPDVVANPRPPEPIRTLGPAAWRCAHYACPERAPVRAQAAPTCYTCGKRMAMVAASDDLLIGHDGDLIMSNGGIDTLQRLREERIARLMESIKPPSFIRDYEPKLFKSWNKLGNKPIEMRISAWQNVLGGIGPMFDLEPLPKSDVDLELAAGEELDVLADEEDLRRYPGVQGASGGIDRETDVELRDRIRIVRAEQRLRSAPAPTGSRADLEAVACLAVGKHVDVRGVTARTVPGYMAEPLIVVEATITAGKLTTALQNELANELFNALPCGMDARLDLVYSTP